MSANDERMRAGPSFSDDDAVTDTGRPHPEGIRRAATLFCILAIAAAVPYLVSAALPFLLSDATARQLGIEESLNRLIAYRPGSPLPFSNLFLFRPPTRPTVAGVEEVQPRLSGDVLSNAPIAAGMLPASAGLAEADGDAEAGGNADADGDGRDLAPFRISPEAYARLPLPIEDEVGAMEGFFRSLLAVAAKEPNAKARILLYSDSINGSDRVSQVLRRRLQERFGDGGKGWVPITPGWQSHRTQDAVWESEGFSVEVINRGEAEDGRYGLGGVVAVDEGGKGRVRIATVASRQTPNTLVPGARASSLELYYQSLPGAGELSLVLDGGNREILSTASPQPRDGWWRTTFADGAHELELRTVSSPLRLYGLVLERAQPGVVVDGLALIGAFTRVLRNWDANHWQDQLRHRDPALLVFWLGGNDAASDNVGFRRDQFVENFAGILNTARGEEATSCLVVSVLDSAREVDGSLRSRRRVPRVVRAQREAARNAGCAFFDGYRATGGQGTAVRWAGHRPRLLGVDHRHLTRAGAEVFGTLLERALLYGYDQWLASGARFERPSRTR